MIDFNYNNFAAVPYFQFCSTGTLLSNLRKRRIGTQQPLTNLDKNIKKPETQSNFTFKQPKSPPKKLQIILSIRFDTHSVKIEEHR